jgi:glycosyltransferase involved in cell wall biosynthesis
VLSGQKIVVVLPAYNAEATLERTYADLDMSVVDDVILVDDRSRDGTAALAQRLNITTIVHDKNLGYGGNQKSCYRAALEKNADIVVMVHPDYQYSPKLVPALACLIASGHYDAALGSRILCGTARRGGMPVYKYISNRVLTLIQNVMMRQKLSEYHTGYRAFSSHVLRTLPLGECDNDFVFDNEMLAQMCFLGYRIGEISCPTRYFGEASSISFWRSVKYGCGVLGVCLKYVFCKLGIARSRLFRADGKKIDAVANPSTMLHSRE